MFLYVLPTVDIVVLKPSLLRSVFCYPLRETCLEHECHRVALTLRPQLHVARTFERVRVRSVRKHGIMQAHTARDETMRLGVIDSLNEAHELAHDVHVVPGRPECILCHHPAIAEHNEVNVGGAGSLRGGSEDSEN